MNDLLDEVHRRLQSEIGNEHSESIGPLSRRDMYRFATASHTPFWSGEEKGPVSAPPLFLSSVMGWGGGPAEDELGADGAGPSETRGIPVGGVRLMGAGQELRFHQPVAEGAVVTSHASLSHLQLKEGRSGKLLIMRIRRRFTDDAGSTLVTCEESFIAR